MSTEPAGDTELKSDSATRNVVFSLGWRLTGAVFTAALTLVLIRKLGPDDYGVFSLAAGLGSALLFISDFGISQSAGRYIAEHRGDRGAVSSVFATALRLKVLISLAVSVLLALLAAPIADAYGIEELTWPLRLIAIAIFGQSILTLWFIGLQSVGRASLSMRLALVESAVETTTSITLLLLGTGVVGAAAGRAAGYIFAAAFGVYVLARTLGLRKPTGAASVPLREIARYAAALAVIDAAIGIFDRIDVLLIGAYLGAEDVGLFEAPLRLTMLLQYVGLAVAGGIAPALAASVRTKADVERFVRALRLLIIVQAALIPPLIVWATPIVDLLLGDDYAESIPILRALSPYVFLLGLSTFVSVSVNYLGRARQRIPVAIAAVTVNIVIDVLLLESLGPIAAAIGTGVALAIYVPPHIWIVRRELGLRLAPTMATLLRSLVAAAAMGGVMAAFGVDHLSPIAWIAGGVLGVTAYITALVALREVRADEVLALPRSLARVGRGTLRRSPGDKD